MQLLTHETEDTCEKQKIMQNYVRRKKEGNGNHDEHAIGKNATLEVERRLIVEKVIFEKVKRSCRSDSDGQPKDKKRKKRNVKEVTINAEITLDFEVRLYH